jgi:hypothetical protein
VNEDVDQLVLELREWESTLRDIEALPETNRSPRKWFWWLAGAAGLCVAFWAGVGLVLVILL